MKDKRQVLHGPVRIGGLSLPSQLHPTVPKVQLTTLLYAVPRKRIRPRLRPGGELVHFSHACKTICRDDERALWGLLEAIALRKPSKAREMCAHLSGLTVRLVVACPRRNGHPRSANADERGVRDCMCTERGVPAASTGLALASALAGCQQAQVALRVARTSEA